MAASKSVIMSPLTITCQPANASFFAGHAELFPPESWEAVVLYDHSMFGCRVVTILTAAPPAIDVT